MFDLDSKFLVDVWDKDYTSSDFIGYREFTLRELLQLSISKVPIALSPPPLPHKQNAGKLVVEVARPGFPQVWIPGNIRQKRSFFPDCMLSVYLKNSSHIILFCHLFCHAGTSGDVNSCEIFVGFQLVHRK
jgi:hypothetical protein